MVTLVQDVRFALRQIRCAPAFAITAVLTLALGVGANTAIFGLLNGYLRPLPVLDADRLVVIAADLPSDESGLDYRFSYLALNDYRDQADVFTDVFAFDTRIGGLTANDKTTQFVYHGVTGNLFSGLQVVPILGRVFEPGEGEHAGGENVVVLGYTFWQKRFARDPGVIGRPIRLDGQPGRIIGVLPPGFHGLYQGVDIEGYVTLGNVRGRATHAAQLFTDRANRHLTMMARLKPGIDIPEAQAAVDVIARRLQAAYPAEKNVSARVLPEPLARPMPMRFLSELQPLIRRSMLALAGLVLLIAGMNVANLLLVRATVRQREMAVRASLGSGAYRLMQMLLAESLVLAIAGTICGLALARWTTTLFIRSVDLSIEMPLNLDYRFDWRVFAYASAMAIGTGVLMGLVPAIRASRSNVTALLHDGGHAGTAGSSRQRARSCLVVAQVAGSLVLLVVAGLFVRTLQRAQTVDLGFDPLNVLTVRLDPHQIGYDLARAKGFYDELERRLRALPGVDTTAMAFSVPMGYLFDACTPSAEGRLRDADDRQPSVGCNPITAGYFDTLRIPIVRGRAFTDEDVDSSRLVTIVNETLARQLWPGEDPIGKRMVFPRYAGSEWLVVGVARDSKYLAVFENRLPHLYYPLSQIHSFMRVVHIRSSVPPDTLGPLVQREIHALDPDIPIADLKTMTQLVQGGFGFVLLRIGAVQATAMGLLGVVLAIVGVYGVVAYGASQRTREIGIRLALGAAPGDIRGLVLRQGLALVAAGIMCGLMMAAVGTRLMARFFFLTGATDLPTFAGVTALLAVIALVACYIPARRAMRVQPVVALRHE